MADRFPLIANSSANQIQEIPSGDRLNLTGTDVLSMKAAGIVTCTGLDVNGNGDISGNLTVGGVLTYEDVTNIDSVGMVTARNGVRVTAGGINVVAGISTYSGTAIFKGGLVEKYENAGTTLGSQTNNPLTDGNVILFTGNESGTNTINFTSVHSTISSGEAVSFTVILTPNNSGYINAVQIDGQAITPQWSGGTAPSAGGSSGRDVYTFTILKTGTGTSDYVILGALTNFA